MKKTIIFYQNRPPAYSVGEIGGAIDGVEPLSVVDVSDLSDAEIEQIKNNPPKNKQKKQVKIDKVAQKQ